jgi:hypothetical protein
MSAFKATHTQKPRVINVDKNPYENTGLSRMAIVDEIFSKIIFDYRVSK